MLKCELPIEGCERVYKSVYIVQSGKRCFKDDSRDFFDNGSFSILLTQFSF